MKPDDGLKLYEARFLLVIRAVTINEHTFIYRTFKKALLNKYMYKNYLKLIKPRV